MGKTWALIFNKSGFKSQSAAHQLCDSVGLVTPSPFASVSPLSPEDFGGPVQGQFSTMLEKLRLHGSSVTLVLSK